MAVDAIPKPVKILILHLMCYLSYSYKFTYQSSVLIISNHWIYNCFNSHVIFWYLCMLNSLPKYILINLKLEVSLYTAQNMINVKIYPV